ncbi:unnamed protein product [Vitrella brassicaformis CCMP3155]|uniref:Chorein N-terminal domain-containing protein n=2 Tax=Vitrella brassicaformis TaxID=1169539 RepID=A0A0G4GLM3_VITBC|nr:unnamed protein product [Vitrella brassicaformis CCMP3155]|eukprot:CEM30978.1 unnamed protein product [Vitrella brassicaformis CCMP3155]
MEHILSRLILSYASRYLHRDFTTDKISLWEGNIVLNQLELKLDVLADAIGVPPYLELARGVIRELRISIPWNAIRAESVKISFDLIEIVVTRRKEPLQQERKERKVENITPVKAPPDTSSAAAKEKGVGSGKGRGKKGWLRPLLTAVVANAVVEVKNLVIRYVQDEVVASLTVGELKWYPTSPAPEWKRGFTFPQGPQQVMHRVLEITDLSISLDPRSKPERGGANEPPTRPPPSQSGAASPPSAALPSLSSQSSFLSVVSAPPKPLAPPATTGFQPLPAQRMVGLPGASRPRKARARAERPILHRWRFRVSTAFPLTPVDPELQDANVQASVQPKFSTEPFNIAAEMAEMRLRLSDTQVRSVLRILRQPTVLPKALSEPHGVPESRLSVASSDQESPATPALPRVTSEPLPQARSSLGVSSRLNPFSWGKTRQEEVTVAVERSPPSTEEPEGGHADDSSKENEQKAARGRTWWEWLVGDESEAENEPDNDVVRQDDVPLAMNDEAMSSVASTADTSQAAADLDEFDETHLLEELASLKRSSSDIRISFTLPEVSVAVEHYIISKRRQRFQPASGASYSLITDAIPEGGEPSEGSATGQGEEPTAANVSPAVLSPLLTHRQIDDVPVDAGEAFHRASSLPIIPPLTAEQARAVSVESVSRPMPSQPAPRSPEDTDRRPRPTHLSERMDVSGRSLSAEGGATLASAVSVVCEDIVCNVRMPPPFAGVHEVALEVGRMYGTEFTAERRQTLVVPVAQRATSERNSERVIFTAGLPFTKQPTEGAADSAVDKRKALRMGVLMLTDERLKIARARKTRTPYKPSRIQSVADSTTRRLSIQVGAVGAHVTQSVIRFSRYLTSRGGSDVTDKHHREEAETLHEHESDKSPHGAAMGDSLPRAVEGGRETEEVASTWDTSIDTSDTRLRWELPPTADIFGGVDEDTHVLTLDIQPTRFSMQTLPVLTETGLLPTLLTDISVFVPALGTPSAVAVNVSAAMNGQSGEEAHAPFQEAMDSTTAATLLREGASAGLNVGVACQEVRVGAMMGQVAIRRERDGEESDRSGVLHLAPSFSYYRQFEDRLAQPMVTSTEDVEEEGVPPVRSREIHVVVPSCKSRISARELKEILGLVESVRNPRPMRPQAIVSPAALPRKFEPASRRFRELTVSTAGTALSTHAEVDSELESSAGSSDRRSASSHVELVLESIALHGQSVSYVLPEDMCRLPEEEPAGKGLPSPAGGKLGDPSAATESNKRLLSHEGRAFAWPFSELFVDEEEKGAAHGSPQPVVFSSSSTAPKPEVTTVVLALDVRHCQAFLHLSSDARIPVFEAREERPMFTSLLQLAFRSCEGQPVDDASIEDSVCPSRGPSLSQSLPYLSGLTLLHLPPKLRLPADVQRSLPGILTKRVAFWRSFRYPLAHLALAPTSLHLTPQVFSSGVAMVSAWKSPNRSLSATGGARHDHHLFRHSMPVHRGVPSDPGQRDERAVLSPSRSKAHHSLGGSPALDAHSDDERRSALSEDTGSEEDEVGLPSGGGRFDLRGQQCDSAGQSAPSPVTYVLPRAMLDQPWDVQIDPMLVYISEPDKTVEYRQLAEAAMPSIDWKGEAAALKGFDVTIVESDAAQDVFKRHTCLSVCEVSIVSNVIGIGESVSNPLVARTPSRHTSRPTPPPSVRIEVDAAPVTARVHASDYARLCSWTRAVSGAVAAATKGHDALQPARPDAVIPRSPLVHVQHGSQHPPLLPEGVLRHWDGESGQQTTVDSTTRVLPGKAHVTPGLHNYAWDKKRQASPTPPLISGIALHFGLSFDAEFFSPTSAPDTHAEGATTGYTLSAKVPAFFGAYRWTSGATGRKPTWQRRGGRAWQQKNMQLRVGKPAVTITSVDIPRSREPVMRSSAVDVVEWAEEEVLGELATPGTTPTQADRTPDHPASDEPQRWWLALNGTGRVVPAGDKSTQPDEGEVPGTVKWSWSLQTLPLGVCFCALELCTWLAAFLSAHGHGQGSKESKSTLQSAVDQSNDTSSTVSVSCGAVTLRIPFRYMQTSHPSFSDFLKQQGSSDVAHLSVSFSNAMWQTVPQLSGTDESCAKGGLCLSASLFGTGGCREAEDLIPPTAVDASQDASGTVVTVGQIAVDLRDEIHIYHVLSCIHEILSCLAILPSSSGSRSGHSAGEVDAASSLSLVFESLTLLLPSPTHLSPTSAALPERHTSVHGTRMCFRKESRPSRRDLLSVSAAQLDAKLGDTQVFSVMQRQTQSDAEGELAAALLVEADGEKGGVCVRVDRVRGTSIWGRLFDDIFSFLFPDVWKALSPSKRRPLDEGVEIAAAVVTEPMEGEAAPTVITVTFNSAELTLAPSKDDPRRLIGWAEDLSAHYSTYEVTPPTHCFRGLLGALELYSCSTDSSGFRFRVDQSPPAGLILDDVIVPLRRSNINLSAGAVAVACLEPHSEPSSLLSPCEAQLRVAILSGASRPLPGTGGCHTPALSVTEVHVSLSEVHSVANLSKLRLVMDVFAAKENENATAPTCIATSRASTGGLAETQQRQEGHHLSDEGWSCQDIYAVVVPYSLSVPGQSARNGSRRGTSATADLQRSIRLTPIGAAFDPQQSEFTIGLEPLQTTYPCFRPDPEASEESKSPGYWSCVVCLDRFVHLARLGVTVTSASTPSIETPSRYDAVSPTPWSPGPDTDSSEPPSAGVSPVPHQLDAWNDTSFKMQTAGTAPATEKMADEGAATASEKSRDSARRRSSRPSFHPSVLAIPERAVSVRALDEATGTFVDVPPGLPRRSVSSLPVYRTFLLHVRIDNSNEALPLLRGLTGSRPTVQLIILAALPLYRSVMPTTKDIARQIIVRMTSQSLSCTAPQPRQLCPTAFPVIDEDPLTHTSVDGMRLSVFLGAPGMTVSLQAESVQLDVFDTSTLQLVPILQPSASTLVYRTVKTAAAGSPAQPIPLWGGTAGCSLVKVSFPKETHVSLDPSRVARTLQACRAYANILSFDPLMQPDFGSMARPYLPVTVRNGLPVGVFFRQSGTDDVAFVSSGSEAIHIWRLWLPEGQQTASPSPSFFVEGFSLVFALDAAGPWSQAVFVEKVGASDQEQGSSESQWMGMQLPVMTQQDVLSSLAAPTASPTPHDDERFSPPHPGFAVCLHIKRVSAFTVECCLYPPVILVNRLMGVSLRFMLQTSAADRQQSRQSTKAPPYSSQLPRAAGGRLATRAPEEGDPGAGECGTNTVVQELLGVCFEMATKGTARGTENSLCNGELYEGIPVGILLPDNTTTSATFNAVKASSSGQRSRASSVVPSDAANVLPSGSLTSMEAWSERVVVSRGTTMQASSELLVPFSRAVSPTSHPPIFAVTRACRYRSAEVGAAGAAGSEKEEARDVPTIVSVEPALRVENRSPLPVCIDVSGFRTITMPPWSLTQIGDLDPRAESSVSLRLYAFAPLWPHDIRAPIPSVFYKPTCPVPTGGVVDAGQERAEMDIADTVLLASDQPLTVGLDQHLTRQGQEGATMADASVVHLAPLRMSETSKDDKGNDTDVAEATLVPTIELARHPISGHISTSVSFHCLWQVENLTGLAIHLCGINGRCCVIPPSQQPLDSPFLGLFHDQATSSLRAFFGVEIGDSPDRQVWTHSIQTCPANATMRVYIPVEAANLASQTRDEGRASIPAVDAPALCIVLIVTVSRSLDRIRVSLRAPLYFRNTTSSSLACYPCASEADPAADPMLHLLHEGPGGEGLQESLFLPSLLPFRSLSVSTGGLELPFCVAGSDQKDSDASLPWCLMTGCLAAVLHYLCVTMCHHHGKLPTEEELRGVSGAEQRGIIDGDEEEREASSSLPRDLARMIGLCVADVAVVPQGEGHLLCGGWADPLDLQLRKDSVFGGAVEASRRGDWIAGGIKRDVLLGCGPVMHESASSGCGLLSPFLLNVAYGLQAATGSLYIDLLPSTRPPIMAVNRTPFHLALSLPLSCHPSSRFAAPPRGCAVSPLTPAVPMTPFLLAPSATGHFPCPALRSFQVFTSQSSLGWQAPSHSSVPGRRQTRDNTMAERDESPTDHDVSADLPSPRDGAASGFADERQSAGAYGEGLRVNPTVRSHLGIRICALGLPPHGSGRFRSGTTSSEVVGNWSPYIYLRSTQLPSAADPAGASSRILVANSHAAADDEPSAGCINVTVVYQAATCLLVCEYVPLPPKLVWDVAAFAAGQTRQNSQRTLSRASSVSSQRSDSYEELPDFDETISPEERLSLFVKEKRRHKVAERADSLLDPLSPTHHPTEDAAAGGGVEEGLGSMERTFQLRLDAADLVLHLLRENQREEGHLTVHATDLCYILSSERSSHAFDGLSGTRGLDGTQRGQKLQRAMHHVECGRLGVMNMSVQPAPPRDFGLVLSTPRIALRLSVISAPLPISSYIESCRVEITGLQRAILWTPWAANTPTTLATGDSTGEEKSPTNKGGKRAAGGGGGVTPSNTPSIIIRIEQSFVHAIVRFVHDCQRYVSAEVLAAPSAVSPQDGDEASHLRHPVSLESVARVFQYMTVKHLSVCQLPVRISLRLAHPVFVSVSDLSLVYPRFELFDVVTPPAVFAKELLAHFLAFSILESPAVLGSLDFLGNPKQAYLHVQRGVVDLLANPLGYSGLRSFVSHVSSASLSAVAAVAESVRMNLPMTTQAQEEAEKQRLAHMSTLMRDLLDADTEAGNGSQSSTSTEGIFSLVGRKLVEAVTRPISGALDVVSSVSRSYATPLEGDLDERQHPLTCALCRGPEGLRSPSPWSPPPFSPALLQLVLNRHADALQQTPPQPFQECFAFGGLTSPSASQLDWRAGCLVRWTAEALLLSVSTVPAAGVAATPRIPVPSPSESPSRPVRVVLALTSTHVHILHPPAEPSLPPATPSPPVVPSASAQPPPMPPKRRRLVPPRITSLPLATTAIVEGGERAAHMTQVVRPSPALRHLLVLHEETSSTRFHLHLRRRDQLAGDIDRVRRIAASTRKGDWSSRCE